MRVVLSSKRPCHLQRGEVRRVPQDARATTPVGYHVACPRCGFPNIVLHGARGQRITEAESGLSFAEAFGCTYCRARVLVSEGQFHIEEGPEVRDVRFR